MPILLAKMKDVIVRSLDHCGEHTLRELVDLVETSLHLNHIDPHVASAVTDLIHTGRAVLVSPSPGQFAVEIRAGFAPTAPTPPVCVPPPRPSIHPLRPGIPAEPVAENQMPLPEIWADLPEIRRLVRDIWMIQIQNRAHQDEANREQVARLSALSLRLQE